MPTVDQGLPADLRVAATLGGEMGQRLLSLDWERHPLGHPAGWPPAIRASAAVALASRFPIVLWVGEELRLLYNDAYIPMLGDKHPAALGMPSAKVWWEIWDQIGPMLDSVVRTGVATWSDDLLLMLVNDGRRQERYFTFTYSPVLGAGGQVEGVFCAVFETTERVLGERRLRSLNALSAAVLEAQSAGSVLSAAIDVCTAHDADLPFAAVYRVDGPLADATLERTTPGVEGVLPASLRPLLAPAVAGEDGLRLISALPSLVPGLTARLGDRQPEQALVVPVSEPDGGTPGAVLLLGLTRDRPLDQQYRGYCRLLADQVTAALASARAYEDERRRAQALADLDRAKTLFLTNVSHEFRTPLTLMLGPLEDVLATAADNPALAGRLEIVRRNGYRLLRLVNSLLDFSRVEAGQAAPVLAAADQGALTAGIASSFTDVCQMAGVDLVLDCAPARASVDPGMWETIVLNLVSNAFKHTVSGSITVRTGQQGAGGSFVSVTDTGTGIAAADLPHLFDRFYRAHDAPGRSTEGSGIGLALVKSLVEMHGGTIEADSALGRGTTMTIRLPAPTVTRAGGAAGRGAGRAPRPAAPATNPFVDEAMQWLRTGTGDLAAARPRSGDRPLVLVADDNADMRRHLAVLLGERWDVLTAADGRQALDLARRHRPDLMVTDVMMPLLDGFGLAAAIRADPELAPLPVIMLTARAGIDAAGEGLAAGADDYLVKPFRSADLVNRVAARLEAAGRDRSRGPHDELTARRGLALAELGTALSAARTPEEALDALLLSAPLCTAGATRAVAALLEHGDRQLRVTFRGDVCGEIADRYHLMDLNAPFPLADVVRSGEPMAVPDTTRLDPRYAQVVADIAPLDRASVLYPLRAADGSVVGALAFSWPRPREFTPAEIELTSRVAGMFARSVTRIAAQQREHQIAIALQERLLEPGQGSTAAVTAAAYQPAAEAMRVGGDWYTVTPLGPGRVGVSAGDVAGHGLDAAATMSQLRSVLVGAALATADPAAVLDLLDQYTRGLPGAAFATAAYAVVDVTAGTIGYTCAGHPYPLVVEADGTTRYLRGGRRLPLGARSGPGGAPPGRARLAPGSLLLLYTDGLIERRREPLDAGFARLAAAAGACARLPAGAACAVLLERLAADGGYGDDVAIVAVRPTGTTAASHVDALPARFTAMADARQRLRRWLEPLAADPVQADRIVLSAGEALANAIEHGSGGNPDRVVGIEAFAEPGAVTVTISDSGAWAKDSAASRGAGRGRGLTLIHGLADEVQTVRGVLGTRITITCRTGGPTDARESGEHRGL
jgi:signal transduction histidine kinase/DNA-binding response OmpR family regulator